MWNLWVKAWLLVLEVARSRLRWPWGLAQSIVTLLISSRLVMPAGPSRGPARRRSQMPCCGLRPRSRSRCPVGQDDAADRLGDRHHLVDADPPAAVSAIRAAPARYGKMPACTSPPAGNLPSAAPPPGCHQLLAAVAEAFSAPGTLRDDQADRVAIAYGFRAHVDQARRGLRRVVGVQRGEHQVAGLRGLDRDLRGLEVLGSRRPSPRPGSWRRKARPTAAQAIRPTFRVDVDLVDARQVDFRRVLRGRDVGVFLVGDVEAGVEARRSCPSRWGR